MNSINTVNGVLVAAQSDFASHAEDKTLHLRKEEREAWNAKADSSDLSGKVDKAELTAHETNTKVHITDEEREKWNARNTKGAVVATQDGLDEHAENTSVHITQEERTAWNEAAAIPEASNAFTGDNTHAGVETFSGPVNLNGSSLLSSDVDLESGALTTSQAILNIDLLDDYLAYRVFCGLPESAEAGWLHIPQGAKGGERNGWHGTRRGSNVSIGVADGTQSYNLVIYRAQFRENAIYYMGGSPSGQPNVNAWWIPNQGGTPCIFSRYLDNGMNYALSLLYFAGENEEPQARLMHHSGRGVNCFIQGRKEKGGVEVCWTYKNGWNTFPPVITSCKATEERLLCGMACKDMKGANVEDSSDWIFGVSPLSLDFSGPSGWVLGKRGRSKPSARLEKMVDMTGRRDFPRELIDAPLYTAGAPLEVEIPKEGGDYVFQATLTEALNVPQTWNSTQTHQKQVFAFLIATMNGKDFGSLDYNSMAGRGELSEVPYTFTFTPNDTGLERIAYGFVGTQFDNAQIIKFKQG